MSAQETKSISNWSEVWSLIYCKYTFDPNLQDILDHFLPFSCCCLLSTYLTYITIDYTYTLRIWVWGSDARPQHYRYVLLLHHLKSAFATYSVVHNRRWASIRKWFQFRELLGFVSAGCVHDCPAPGRGSQLMLLLLWRVVVMGLYTAHRARTPLYRTRRACNQRNWALGRRTAGWAGAGAHRAQEELSHCAPSHSGISTDLYLYLIHWDLSNRYWLITIE